MQRTKHDKPIRSRDFNQKATETDWVKYKHDAASNGICYNTFISRVRSGKHPKIAATTPRQQIHGCYEWVGDTLDTRRGHCAALGLNYHSVATYMHKHLVNFEDAVLVLQSKKQLTKANS